MRILIGLMSLAFAATALSGCIITKPVGAVVGAAGDVAEGTVNVTKGAAGAAIPDGDKND